MDITVQAKEQCLVTLQQQAASFEHLNGKHKRQNKRVSLSRKQQPARQNKFNPSLKEPTKGPVLLVQQPTKQLLQSCRAKQELLASLTLECKPFSKPLLQRRLF